MHFYLQKYALLPTYPFPCTVFYLSVCVSQAPEGKLWLCGGGLSSHSESVTEGRWCMVACGGEVRLQWTFLIAPTFYSVQESPSAHSKSKTYLYSYTLCIKNCITSNHCHAFCPSFCSCWNVAEMHNLSSTAHRDAIRKYICRIAVYCVSCVIALVFCKRFISNILFFCLHFSLNILCMSLYHMQWTGHATSLFSEKL